MIYFFGDVHGHFDHVLDIVVRDRPAAIVLLGDLQAQRPLEAELEFILEMTEVWFIHGNHDTDSDADYDHLFGSALALNDSALWLLGSISTLTLVALAILLRPLVLECLDPDYLATVSRAGSWVHMAFLLLAVLNLIAGFHALGTLMSVGIMILPGAAMRYWTRHLGPMLVGSCLAAFVSALSGLLFSYHLGWPTSPTIILTLGLIYFLSLLAGPQGGLMWRYIRLRHLEA